MARFAVLWLFSDKVFIFFVQSVRLTGYIKEGDVLLFWPGYILECYLFFFALNEVDIL